MLGWARMLGASLISAALGPHIPAPEPRASLSAADAPEEPRKTYQLICSCSLSCYSESKKLVLIISLKGCIKVNRI